MDERSGLMLCFSSVVIFTLEYVSIRLLSCHRSVWKMQHSCFIRNGNVNTMFIAKVFTVASQPEAHARCALKVRAMRLIYMLPEVAVHRIH